ncbi:MAG: vWA domain-containing protein [Chitinophagaceae bacterium]
MNRPLHLTVAACTLFFCQTITEPYYRRADNNNPKIQVAILLDVSNSMDGLIEQAKAQLWNMVSVMGRVTCEGVSPNIEIALYEYGRSSNSVVMGYVKQISSFTNDLDKFFHALQDLTTNGGDEYCGYVINSSLDQLNWDTSAASYKTIFIAGNESFFQGNISYTEACKKAKEKGVIVNTVYCGSKERGIAEHWNLGAECSNGNFTNIDKDAKEKSIPTPYDSTLFVLNEQLNLTYIYYGDEGYDKLQAMRQMDTVPEYDVKDINKIMGYVVVKSDKKLYNRSQWDLIDAYEKDISIIEKVDMKTLPDSLKNQTRSDLKKVVETKAAERSIIRKKIANLNTQRNAYISAEKNRLKIDDPLTLKSEIEKTIRDQVKRFKMKVQ